MAMSGMITWYMRLGEEGASRGDGGENPGGPFDWLRASRESVHEFLLLCLLTDAAADDEVRAALLWRAGLHSKGVLTPWRLWILHTDWGVSFSTSVWVIHSVHGLTKHFRLLTEPTVTSGFTDRDEVVVRIRDGSDRGIALLAYLAHFSAWELDDGVVAIQTDENGAGTC